MASEWVSEWWYGSYRDAFASKNHRGSQWRGYWKQARVLCMKPQMPWLPNLWPTTNSIISQVYDMQPNTPD